MERDLRRAYLFSLRDRLRHSLADAASKIDALTGLANRHHLDMELRRLWATDGERPAMVSAITQSRQRARQRNGSKDRAAACGAGSNRAAIMMAWVRGAAPTRGPTR
jgi:PleD family two-component response regulator